MASPKARSIRFFKLVDMGCIACKIDGFGYTVPEIHHLRDGQGMGQRAPDTDTIPLCAPHHRGMGLKMNSGIPGLHSHPKKFRERYGSERELLSSVNEELGCEEQQEQGQEASSEDSVQAKTKTQ